MYAQIFIRRRDALFDALDALLSSGTFSSFALLSQSERFQRKWPSLYAAVEDGEIDTDALRALVVRQFPQEGVCIFPPDSSSWPRPRGRVLEDLQYVYQASSDVNGGAVTVGYPYSLLEWCAEAQLTDWGAPLSLYRLGFDRYRDLTKQFHVFRAPALGLVNANGQAAWKQDECLSVQSPLDLYQFKPSG